MGLFQPLVDAHFKAHASIREPDGFWHPSSMTGCERQAVYEQTKTEKTDETDIRSTRIMANGTRMHEEIQAMLMAKHPGFLPEVRVEGLGGIWGHCDGLLPVADGQEDGETGPVVVPVYELQEFKSIGPNGKKFMKPKPYGKESPTNRPVPKPEHVKQARIYYACLEEMGYLLDNIRISYFDRDDWSVLEFEVEPWTDDELMSFIIELESLKMHSKYGTLPARKDPDFWLCRYCPFRTRCWKQDKETTRA